MKRFWVIGVNHKYAPLEVREVLAFPDQALPLALKTLREGYGIEQAVILSTCNRVEIVVFCAHNDGGARLRAFLAAHHHVGEDFFAGQIYELQGLPAVEHVFRVAASMDSMVLGETQILGQYKQAYQIASAERATGKALNMLMQRAFAAAKQVHAHTSIGRGQVSVASAAVSFIRRIFDDLEHKTAMLLGTGEMARLTMTHLREAGIGKVLVVSRTIERAREFAQAFGGDAVPSELLDDYLPRADVVVSQTAAPVPVITRERMARAMKARGHRPMFVVDLAVPRDVQVSVSELDGVYRYDMDDLEHVVAQSNAARAGELDRAQKIVDGLVREFAAAFQELTIEPAIAELRSKAEEVLEREFQRVSGRLEGLAPDDLSEVRQFAERVVNKLLHTPIRVLKEEARDGNADLRTLELASRMFDLTKAAPDEARKAEQHGASDAVLPETQEAPKDQGSEPGARI